MDRIKISKRDRERFFHIIKNRSGFSWSKLSNSLGVSDRTFRNWKNGIYTIDKVIFNKLLSRYCNKENFSFLILPDFWHIKEASRKGALSRLQKYGPPGTPEGRSKGGRISQERRKLHPELYRNCNIEKKILHPSDSTELAELFGIILGDGGIGSKYQVIIALNKENDTPYIDFVCSLIGRLFGITPAIYQNNLSVNRTNLVEIAISSVAFVNFLLNKGLKVGNKVRQQISVPDWIVHNAEFAKSCMRGLIDTDGGVYYHRHSSHNCNSFNIGLCFANRSLPLLSFVKNQLEALQFHPKINLRLVSLYREEEVFRYAKEIQFHNFYHFKRIQEFIKIKSGKGSRVV